MHHFPGESHTDCNPPDILEGRHCLTAPASLSRGGCNPEGRPKVHASAAARKRAHRAGKVRLDALVNERTGLTIAKLANDLGCSKNEVVNSLIRFALTNRNWAVLGLMGSAQ